MSEEGKYVYCVIKGDDWREFAVKGVGGPEDRVYTINYLGLAAVVSDWPSQTYTPTSHIAKAHDLVVKEVFKDFTVIPVMPGCVARNATRVKKEILRDRSDYLRKRLLQMDNKVEIGLKALWKSNPMFANSIDNPEDPKIKRLRQALVERILEQPPRKRVIARVALAEMIEKAVADFRAREARNILAALEHLVVDERIKAATSLKTVLNAAFLVNKGREREFFDAVNELDTRYKKEIQFKCAGPLPPYSFANLVIKLEQPL